MKDKMKEEGRVLGCEACRELRLEEIHLKNKKEMEKKALGASSAPKQNDRKKSRSFTENRKSANHKRKLLPGGRIEGEPEWWGAGVNRVISVGPGDKNVEEVENDICERTYAARKTKALEDRGEWVGFLKRLAKKYNEAMTKSLGPEWFQDLSPRQMGLFDNLHEILDADLQEDISDRTRRTLAQIGIYPPLPKREVSRCMQECVNNSIRFLFLIHKVVVEREQGPYEKEYNEAAKDEVTIQTYSINERLLLSGVFHLHFDEFVRKLDKLLPPPPEKPKLILSKRPLPEPKKKYKSPYLEPLPIAEKVWYEQRMEDEIYAKQARLVALQEKKEFEQKVLKDAEDQRRAKEERLKKLLEQKTVYETSKSLKRTVDSSNHQEVAILRRENKSQFYNRFSVDDDTMKRTSSVTSKSSNKSLSESNKSLHHVRKNRRYMYDVVHSNIQTKTSFGGFFDRDNRLLKDSEGVHLKIRLVPKTEKVVCLYRDDEFKPVQILDTRVRICCRTVGIQTDAEPMFLPINVCPEVEFYKLMEKINATSSEASTNTENSRTSLETEGKEETKTTTSKVPISEDKPINVECTDEKCALVEGNIPLDEFVMMKNKIMLYPPEKQLKVAVAFLCRRGDPLAILPQIEETPWLQRWFELRRGIKEKLTAEEKDDLMQISTKLWSAAYRNVGTIIIKPFKVKRRISSLEKSWLLKKIHNYKSEFQTRLRQQLVNNAREYFPTFYDEYFTSPLLKTIRKTFYTYLSSREMDAYVYKVWNLECKEMVKKDKLVAENASEEL